MPGARAPGDFAPPRWLRGAHLQSTLPGLPLRRGWVEHRARKLLAVSRELLLDCGEGVRLQAFHSPALKRGVPRLAVLLHGWEGSASSLYVIALAHTLHAAGIDVVRLNLRDHGDTHHLNADLFHSCRLAEVIGAVRRLQWLFPHHRCALAGFSLGGNFVLRVAAEAPAAGLDIAAAIGISPVLDPVACLDALERGWWLYRAYFLQKWTTSLRRKQRAWPGRFNFSALLAARDLRAMTRELVLSHAGFADLDSYFRGYTLTGERLAGLRVPATILAALDDPIVPAADLSGLAATPWLRVVALPTGGHCGFFDSLVGPGWAERFVLRELFPTGATR